MHSGEAEAGFTLIEMAIVLVVIGLIVGGVLLGQDLIRAAETRATITQIEKYNTAVNTFRGKFNALPGDLNGQIATQFGFAARGSHTGQGDGDGEIEGNNNNTSGGNYSHVEDAGETVMFWVDLSSAVAGNLIEGGFNTASSTIVPNTDITGTVLNLWLPQAKLGHGNYFYVYSGNYYNGSAWANLGVNYFGLSAVSSIVASSNGTMSSTANIPVAQAYAIDRKIDDGLPQSGNVMAWFLNDHQRWTDGTDAYTTANEPTPTTAATAGSSTTCYDNSSAASGTPGIANATQHYSMEINSGAGANCALSFKFQ